MKNLIYGLGGTGLLIIAIIIIVTINGRMTRNKEMTSALSNAMDQAVDATLQNDIYTVNEKELFVAAFVQNLMNTIENNSDVEVRIMKADEEKGLLSLKVIEHYINPNGKTGKVSYAKTLLLNESSAYDYIVMYLQAGTTIKTEYVNNEENLIPPDTVNEWNLEKSDGSLVRYTKEDVENLKASNEICSTEDGVIKLIAIR